MKNGTPTKLKELSKARLATSTGLIFEGRSCGASGTATGELVFNTGMSGYQELITDPATRGQVLIFTMTQVGNYGVNRHDETSGGVHPEAVVAREIADVPSNWASEGSLPEYLAKHAVVAIDQVDTRMLTRHVRDYGPLDAVVTTLPISDEELLELAKSAKITPILTDAELVAQELGATLTRLHPGHHASNIPVRDLRSGEVLITTQHHSFALDFEGVAGVEITHINLNDQTVEGFAVPDKGIEVTLFKLLEIRELVTPEAAPERKG